MENANGSVEFIEKYKPYFENLLTPIINLLENFEPSEFRTQEFKIKTYVENRFQNINWLEGKANLVGLVQEIDLSAFADKEKTNLNQQIMEKENTDFRFHKLTQLAKRIDDKYPNAALAVLLKNNPMDFFAKAFEPHDLIDSFGNETGEKAARAAVRIYREVAELLYEDYITAIYEFLEILEGKTIIMSYQSFGVLVNGLSSRLEKYGYQDMVDPNAAWIRNATCHGNWRYIPEKDKIVLWDKNRPEKEFSSRELFEMAMSLYSMVAENFYPFIFIYLKKKVVNEWFDLLKYLQDNILEILDNEDSKIKHLETMIKEIFNFTNEIEFRRNRN